MFSYSSVQLSRCMCRCPSQPSTVMAATSSQLQQVAHKHSCFVPELYNIYKYLMWELLFVGTWFRQPTLLCVCVHWPHQITFEIASSSIEYRKIHPLNASYQFGFTIVVGVLLFASAQSFISLLRSIFRMQRAQYDLIRIYCVPICEQTDYIYIVLWRNFSYLFLGWMDGMLDWSVNVIVIPSVYFSCRTLGNTFCRCFTTYQIGPYLGKSILFMTILIERSHIAVTFQAHNYYHRKLHSNK